MMISNRPQGYTKSQRASAPVSRARRTRLAALCAIVLLIGAAAVFRAPLAGFFWRVAAPLMQARYGSVQSDAVKADRDALYQENLDLKARLGRPGVAPARLLGAVLMRPPGTPYDTLVIDVGTAEGVTVGEYVSAGGTALIGVVSESYTHAARVKLFSAPGERHDALLHGNVPLKIEGQGGGSMVAQAPSGTIVAVGDTALIPGIASGVAATVSRVETIENSFVTIYFQLPADIFTLRFVEVWKETPHDTK